MSINFRRGFFRLWIALAVLWIAPAVYLNLERIDTGSVKPWELYQVYPDHPPPPPPGFVLDMTSLTPDQRAAIADHRSRIRNEALLTIFAPPLALLALGVGVGWIASGFRRKPS